MDNSRLALELAQRLNDTFQMRLRYFDHPDDPEALQSLAELSQQNITRLREIIRTYGWPGVHLVGEAGATAAGFLVILPDVDLSFKRRYLSLMLAAGPQEVPSTLVATLADQVSIADGKPPIYGVLYGIAPPDENGPHPFGREWLTDDRRAKVNLTLFLDVFPGLARLLARGGIHTLTSH